MKLISIRSILATVVLAATSFSPVAQAQNIPSSLTITAPFDFEYGSQLLPAGTYKITNGAQRIVRVSNGKKSSMVTVAMNSSPFEASNNQVVFHKVGGQYFLRQILTTGRKEYVALAESKEEKKARVEQVASSRGTQESFEIAVLRAAN